jgi:hypothetical protein
MLSLSIMSTICQYSQKGLIKMKPTNEAENISEAIQSAREYCKQFASLQEADNKHVCRLLKRYGFKALGEQITIDKKERRF